MITRTDIVRWGAVAGIVCLGITAAVVGGVAPRFVGAYLVACCSFAAMSVLAAWIGTDIERAARTARTMESEFEQNLSELRSALLKKGADIGLIDSLRSQLAFTRQRLKEELAENKRLHSALEGPKVDATLAERNRELRERLDNLELDRGWREVNDDSPRSGVLFHNALWDEPIFGTFALALLHGGATHYMVLPSVPSVGEGRTVANVATGFGPR